MHLVNKWNKKVSLFINYHKYWNFCTFQWSKRNRGRKAIFYWCTFGIFWRRIGICFRRFDARNKHTKRGKMSEFKYKVGETYETQAGDFVKVINRTDLKGYECLVCMDGRHRYDRSTGNADAGRCTGTAHDYSCEHNFKRKD